MDAFDLNDHLLMANLVMAVDSSGGFLDAIGHLPLSQLLKKVSKSRESARTW